MAFIDDLKQGISDVTKTVYENQDSSLKFRNYV